MLLKEADDDNDLRRQFGSKWSRVPSAQNTTTFFRDIDTVESYLKKASSSDKEISQEMVLSLLALCPRCLFVSCL